MTNNSKKRLERDKEAVRKFQAETERRRKDLRKKVLADQAKVKKFFQEGR